MERIGGELPNKLWLVSIRWWRVARAIIPFGDAHGYPCAEYSLNQGLNALRDLAIRTSLAQTGLFCILPARIPMKTHRIGQNSRRLYTDQKIVHVVAVSLVGVADGPNKFSCVIDLP